MKYDMEPSVGSSCVWGEVCQAEYSWYLMCVLKDKAYQISISVVKNVILDQYKGPLPRWQLTKTFTEAP